jgi:hypothetical protein
MRFLKIFAVTAALLGAAAIVGAQEKGKGGKGKGFQLPPMIKLSMTGFADGGTIPAKHAGGMGVSPQMSWTGAPATTQSYVLIMHDPDPVLQGSATNDVLHWAIFDIPGTATGLPENVPKQSELPDGSKQLNNIANQPGYFGPGPPAGHGAHHYTFQIWALNAKLDLPPTTSRADLMNAMNGKVVAKGVYIGMYENK